MTDKQVLITYRLQQARETLSDAEKMLQDNLSPNSVINRAYYTMFYALLALFLKDDINLKTSKHTGIISMFDREFIHTNKVEAYYSKILHQMFELRQEGDYKELVKLSVDDAAESIKLAKEFLEKIKGYIEKKHP